MTEERKPRRLRGPVGRCPVCRQPIVFAVTVATQFGRGGQPLPLDLYENPAGKVATYQPHARGRLHARVLDVDETHDVSTEVRAMPHMESCCSGLVDEIEEYLREHAE